MELLRLQRLQAPSFDDVDIVVKQPPDIPAKVAVNAIARLMPLAMVIATAGMVVLYFRSGTGGARSPMFLIFPAMMLLSAVGSAAYGARDSRRSSDVEEGRRGYLRYLDSLDAVVTRTAVAQHGSLTWTHPEPASLWTLIGGRRMWERLPGDADFCHVRLGLSTSELATRLVAPEVASSGHVDHVAAEWLRRFLASRSTVANLPFAVDLPSNRWITLDGDVAQARSLLRAAICQLVVLHGPECVKIVAAVDERAQSEWDWLKWLPHHQDPDRFDSAGMARMTYRELNAAALKAVGVKGMGVKREDVHVVVIVDGGDATNIGPPPTGVTIIEVGNCGAVGREKARRIDVSSVGSHGRLDTLTPNQALVCARGLAPYRASAVDGIGSAIDGWARLNGVGDPASIDPAVAWRPRLDGERLRVAIGLSDSGQPVELDIKEAAHGGTGPHGLCIGATGSGKSEFLRTLALGLIATHPPEILNLVLVDFKGGATFLGFEQLRHTAAVITNLSNEAHLVARMKDALAGEVTRRQETLRAAGNFASLGDYEAARVAGAAIPRLPALLVVVDEFSELLSQHPDFAELFVAIGRVGRSLGIHLLLASQRLDEGRLRGLESHLSYRICLKTFSAGESRAVLGTSDAYELPVAPGAAYLKSASGELTRFHAAFVSESGMSRHAASPDGIRSEPTRFTAIAAGVHVGGDHSQSGMVPASQTVLSTVLDRLSDRGTPAYRVWSPPFTVSPALDEVLGSPAGEACLMPSLTVPIGLVDNPFEQRRDPLVADLSAAGGNVAFVGGPRSGKSTALRTLVLALAATHRPDQVQIYGLDFGGGTLTQTRGLPHVGSVAGRHEPDLVRRIVAQLQALVHRRGARLRSGGADAVFDDSRGEVLLVVDGWATVRHEFDGLEESITMLAAQGLSVGVHVVLSASRWMEIRPALKDLIGSRFELRLGDPTDSEMNRARARLLVDSPPGRGITRDGLELVIALPRLDGMASTRGLDEALDEAAGLLRDRHRGHSALPVELMPTKVHHESVVAPVAEQLSRTHLVLGLGENELRPLTIDLTEQSHLLILGESGAGKTATLRTLCRELRRVSSAEEVQLVVIDYRRTLLGVVESDHLAGYAMSRASAEAHIGAAVRLLRARLPPDGVTQEQLRERSWWSGPEMYVIVDDYDLVAGVVDNPLAALIELLPHARDLGLHMVVARRSGGAARAMFDPLLARIRELGCLGLVMSASPEDGPLLGSVRPRPLPPGRGVVIRRGKSDQLVQVGWTDLP